MLDVSHKILPHSIYYSKPFRCHPAPGPVGSVSLSGCLALEMVTVEYKGHT